MKIKAPIQNPEKIICLGMNYIDHCLEQNQPVPETPVLFFKLPSSIIGTEDIIVCPDIVKVSDALAWFLVVITQFLCH